MRPDTARLVGKRVLLVEDELLVAMELEAALSAAGCNVVGPAAADIKDAKDFIARAKAKPGSVSYGSAGAGSGVPTPTPR